MYPHIFASMNATNPPVIGVIGGGQLGQMLALEAPRLSLKIKTLDAAGPLSPTGKLAESGAITGSLKDVAALKQLAEGCDVVTMEIEHVSVAALEELEAAGVTVRPSSATIKIIQDKLIQKDHFAKAGIPLPPYMDCPDVAAVEAAAAKFGLPVMLKSRKEGYDGRGNAVLKKKGESLVFSARRTATGKATNSDRESYEQRPVKQRTATGETTNSDRETAWNNMFVCPTFYSHRAFILRLQTTPPSSSPSSPAAARAAASTPRAGPPSWTS